MAVAIGRYTETKRKKALAIGCIVTGGVLLCRPRIQVGRVVSFKPLFLASGVARASVNQDDNACNDHAVKKDGMTAA